jgi:hypothetical protein
MSLDPHKPLQRYPSSDPKHPNVPTTEAQAAASLNYSSGPVDSQANNAACSYRGGSGESVVKSALSSFQDEHKLVVHEQTLLELQAKVENMEKLLKHKVRVDFVFFFSCCFVGTRDGIAILTVLRFTLL